LLVAVFFVACSGSDKQVASQTQEAVSAATPYPDGARRVTIEEVEKLIAEGKAFIVDVRTQDAYNVSHIPNSILIPSGEIVNHINELPRDKIIVTYCS
jgi:ArsR family transcriptional regulator